MEQRKIHQWVFEDEATIQEVDSSPRPPVPSGTIGDFNAPARGKAAVNVAVGLISLWTLVVLMAVFLEYAKGNTTTGLEIAKNHMSQFVLLAGGWLYGRGISGR